MRPLHSPPRAALAIAFLLCGAAAGDWRIGSHVLSTAGQGAGALREPAAGPAGLFSLAYLEQTGGVDFEAVAAAPGPVRLRYDARAPDGRRLVVMVAGREAAAALPDWQLKPIAALADSPYTADVSLFGDGPDTEHTLYPRFHPALRDTLLGLRLLQADLMLMDPHGYRQMPARDGAVVLGAGETMPDDAASAGAADELAAVIGMDRFQSWLLTDIGEPAIVDGAGRTDLHPFYYFWSTRVGTAALRLVRLASLERIVAPSERPGVRAEMATAATRFTALEREPAGSDPPHAVADLTARLRAREAVLASLNPPVWAAVRATARYAALFRLARASDPEAWRGFVGSLASVRVEPAVRTPVSMGKG